MVSPVAKPSKYPEWASTIYVDPITNAPNIVEPTDSHKATGWTAFEPPPRNYFNWYQNLAYQWIEYFDYRANGLEVISDGNGAQVFGVTNTAIKLFAVDKTTPANYIVAVGWRGTSTPTLNVVSHNVLTLGTSGADGSQAISGGTASNIILWASSLQ